MGYTQTPADWKLYVELVLVFIALIALCFSIKSANSANKSATDSIRATNYSILTKLMDDYSSNEINEGMNLIRTFMQDNPEQFIEDFPKNRYSTNQAYKEMDNTRRKISHWFTKIMQLKDIEILDEEYILKIVNIRQMNFFLEVSDKLDEAINKDRGTKHDLTTSNFVVDLKEKKEKMLANGRGVE